MKVFLFILGVLVALGLSVLLFWAFFKLRRDGYRKPEWSQKNKVVKWGFDHIPQFCLVGSILMFGVAMGLLAFFVSGL